MFSDPAKRELAARAVPLLTGTAGANRSNLRFYKSMPPEMRSDMEQDAEALDYVVLELQVALAATTEAGARDIAHYVGDAPCPACGDFAVWVSASRHLLFCADCAWRYEIMPGDADNLVFTIAGGADVPMPVAEFIASLAGVQVAAPEPVAAFYSFADRR